jgi:diguanylate cyclase (GGDEF)-like protein/PAS domain S-box-containing protein
MGLLQGWELAALDQLFCLRPREAIDRRIVIVGISEADLKRTGTWPIPDRQMALLLKRIQSYQPRVIGLDIYRDLPVPPGYEALQQAYKSMPNLVGIEQIRDSTRMGVGIPAPRTLAERQQVGFNNIVLDVDGKARRGLLYWTLDSGVTFPSFALKTALEYLKVEGIVPQEAPNSPDDLQLGRGIFRRFEENDGAYVGADDGGYQILSNPRGAAGSFLTVSMTDVLGGKVSPTIFHDRIVLIGSTAISLKDFFYTSYSSNLPGASPQSIAGVELQANYISQIISAALEGRSLLQVWAKPWQWVWVLFWAWVGAEIVWQLRAPRRFAPAIAFCSSGLVGLCFLAFLAGWWIPLIPPLMALTGAAVGITAHLAHLEEELKRSKEFLNSIINTIPDPVFVKDGQHRWIVLNQAFCTLIGYPPEKLLNQKESDFFPSQKADLLRQQDQVVFDTAQDQESEAEFTDRNGMTCVISTKRSLHRDAAGNLFLVGVMRDITERKQMEEDLKRTAAELIQSNAELKESATHLRHLANHDPLTGLPNRKLFQERLNQALGWAKENGQQVALLFLDLDGFKSINDNLGHDVGDLLLQAISRRLIGCLRGSDTVARLGGDEFTVILPAIPGLQDTARVAEKILFTLSQPYEIEENTIRVTSSIGISLYPVNGEETEILIKEADSAMYAAKEAGKSRYQFASDM